ncbi:hypothetical protein HCN44_006173 [Aphidius gifuensis]|uniref:Complementary sex determination N-terminal domain-containing protein n=1 Tax=Aphidius gifuensis TaxID=684658 RepID=A0A834Y4E9_APHGI|nr:hypothetical protein HCN44_006173 [Aphidius gifuensis]
MPYQNHSRRDRDDHRLPVSREEELRLMRIRKEWKKMQELKEKHERHKQERIEKFELERARKLALQKSKTNRSSHSPDSSRSRSRDNNKSRSGNHSIACKTSIMSEKCDTGSSSTKLFKGPEGTKISIDELKKIKIEIGKQKKIGSTNKTADIERDIINPEDVIVRRRDGEGANPIFEREELNPKDTEDKERRVIVETNEKNENKRRRSISLSPPRRSRSPSRRTSRHESSSRHHGNHNERHGSPREHRNSRHSSYHRSPLRDERDSRYHSSRSSTHRDYHHARDNSRDRRNGDDRIRDRGISYPHPYMTEPIPLSMYYGNFVRPMIMDPLMAMRAPMPPMMRGRVPQMMGHMRPPFGARFQLPPQIFRPNMPPNQRFGRMF